MSRMRSFCFLAAFCLFGAIPAFATEYQVGTCRQGLKSYPSISAAVVAVPAGSTVDVCPNTYAEQVVISQPLTLLGVSNGESDQVIIAASNGVSPNATTLDGSSLAAQILVTAGPVTIRRITVDGTGNGLGDSVLLAGIYFASGASGTIGGVTTRNQTNGGNGVGIYAENGLSSSETLTIQNSSVHDYDYVGLWLNGNVNATVDQNFVSSSDESDFTYGILVGYPNPSTVAVLRGNDLTGPGADVDAQAITINTPSATANNNTLADWYYAIADFGASSYTNNSIRNNKIGISFGVAGATAQGNSITQTFAAVDFNCVMGNVSENLINDANYAMYLIPAGQDPSNDLANIVTINGSGCSALTPAMVSNHTSNQIKPARRGGKQ